MRGRLLLLLLRVGLSLALPKFLRTKAYHAEREGQAAEQHQEHEGYLCDLERAVEQQRVNANFKRQLEALEVVLPLEESQVDAVEEPTKEEKANHAS